MARRPQMRPLQISHSAAPKLASQPQLYRGEWDIRPCAAWAEQCVSGVETMAALAAFPIQPQFLVVMDVEATCEVSNQHSRQHKNVLVCMLNVSWF